MIEYIAGYDQGRGTTMYLKGLGDRGWGLTSSRHEAFAFSSLGSAQQALSKHLRGPQLESLFADGAVALSARIEPRLTTTTKALTPEMAEELLGLLKRHVGQPILPVGRFWEALWTWFRCIEECNKESGAGSTPPGRDYHDQLWKVQRDLRHSDLLHRLLHCGEKLRTIRCPEHGGRSGNQKCEHGCGGTGWLPEEG